MGKRGIRDRVAIIGGGATKFGELWDKGVEAVSYTHLTLPTN